MRNGFSNSETFDKSSGGSSNFKKRKERGNGHQTACHFPKENIYNDVQSTTDDFGLSHHEGF